MTVLSVRNLSVDYGVNHPTHAVRDVSLSLRRGEVLGIAGESGCGKSTLAYAVTRLLRAPARLTGGQVLFHPEGATQPIDVMALSGRDLRAFRWRRIAMVFQSAMNSLNPVLSVRKQLADIFTAHEPDLDKREVQQRCRELMELVGIDASRLSSYPHELSGGMRQRVTIAMALALRPDVVVMDEPTTALDVVVQWEILNEVNRLRDMFGFAVIFITHDLSLLLEISDQLAIMYAGRIVEQGTAAEILNRPHHPYTVGLLRSFPSLLGPRRSLRGIPGSPPDLSLRERGCSFAPRCPYAFEACTHTRPELAEVTDKSTLAGAPVGVGTTLTACLQYDPGVRPEGSASGLRARQFDPSILEVR